MHAPRPSSAGRRRGLPITAALLTALVMVSAPRAAADPPATQGAGAEPAAERVPAPKASAADGKTPKASAATSGTKAKPATPDKPAADGRCDRCGSRCCVVKVCAPRCTEQEITKISWETECEDFCVPGRSRRCPDACGKQTCLCRGGATWEPGCGSVRSREVLVKKTTKESKPTVEWQVEERCGACRGDARCTAAGCTAAPGPTAGDALGAGLGRLWPFPRCVAAGPASAGGTAR
ncbi:MAG: hypothetical protein ACKO3G_18615 [Planctomycetaceae bacterium]